MSRRRGGIVAILDEPVKDTLDAPVRDTLRRALGIMKERCEVLTWCPMCGALFILDASRQRGLRRSGYIEHLRDEHKTLGVRERSLWADVIANLEIEVYA